MTATIADLELKLRLDHEAADRAARATFPGYLKAVVADSRPDPRKFGKIAEPWQWSRAASLGPAIESICRVPHRPRYDGPPNFWFGYSKGHDKTGFIARTFNYVLGYARRPLTLYACAEDRDQAKLIRDAMKRELDLNPWLAARVQVNNYEAFGVDNGSKLEILASDSDSAQGKTPDIMVFDEITHWSDEEFFDAMYSARNKRPGSIVVVLTNAGIKNTWQWELRNQAAASPRWKFFEQPERVMLASWMDAKAIAEDRKLLIPSEAARLLDNRWIDPGEANGYLLLADCEACHDFTVRELPLDLTNVNNVLYRPDGTLVPRSDRDAVLHDIDRILDHVFRLVDGTVRAVDGTVLPVTAGSICVHGDTPGAVAMAERIHRELTARGVVIQSFA